MRPGDANSLIINVLDAENLLPDSLDLSAIDTVLGPENILRTGGWQRLQNGWTNAIEFTFFEEGKWEIPSMTMKFRSPAGGNFLVKTSPKTLNIVPENITDTTALREIKDIRREPISWLDHLPVLLTILAVLLAAVLFIWWKSRRNPGRTIRNPQSENPQSAWELAFVQLDILEKKSLWQSGWAKQYHTELTEILRGYLSRRFGISAFKKTSGEILAALEQTDGFPKELAENLRQLFKTVDLVKFARAEPPNDFHQQALAETRKLVHATIPETSQSIENQELAPENGEFQRRIKVAFHALPNQPSGILGNEVVLKYAEPSRRFSAAMIDILVWLGGSVGILRLLWAVVEWLEFADDGKVGSAAIALFLLAGLIGFGYFFHVNMEKMGATPGKIAFGIRTVDESGGPISLTQAQKRASLKLNPAYWEIGKMGRRPLRQMGYDEAAGTVVAINSKAGSN